MMGAQPSETTVMAMAARALIRKSSLFMAGTGNNAGNAVLSLKRPRWVAVVLIIVQSARSKISYKWRWCLIVIFSNAV